MPLYDYVCDECGHFEADFYLPLAEFGATVWCPNDPFLEAEMRTAIAAVSTIGPMPSKPVYGGGAEVSIHSAEEMREYKRKNPNSHFVDKNDSWMVRHRDQARERAESVARRQGFRDWEQRREVLRRDQNRRKQLDG